MAESVALLTCSLATSDRVFAFGRPVELDVEACKLISGIRWRLSGPESNDFVKISVLVYGSDGSVVKLSSGIRRWTSRTLLRE